MKAVWYESNGPADKVLVYGDMADPVPAAGEVLVRLHASGVNPSDVKARAGSRPMGFPRVIPHSDGAGIVEAVGAGVDPSLVGSRVFVRNGQWRRAFGTAADYIALDAGCVHPLPDGIGFDTGAALGIPALTAACAVLRDGPVAGETILVHGAGGTVARLAVQIAADCGAGVIATTGRPERADDVMAAGAEAVIDYRSGNLVEAVADAAAGRPVTRVIDSECGLNLASSIEILAEKGVIVGYGSVLEPAPELPFLTMMFKNLTLSSILVYLLGDEEAAAYAAIVSDMLERGALDARIQKVLPLEDAARAHGLVEAGDRAGAVILSTA
ncbi:MAG: NADPH:quinone reductase [Pseudomonadota bacterium]|nr:NADPH:quinone reductase [Pseudomonadota bacterium]